MTTATATLTVAIADDERLARGKLRDFVSEIDGVTCVGEARNGSETVALVNRVRPDVLFLDVRMPGLDGFQVLRHLTHPPVVIFTTAHDEYAVAAFEVRALDYLLKPFGRARFREALARARESLDDPLIASIGDRARDALVDNAEPLRQIFVRVARRIVPVNIAHVTRFEAADDYVTIYANGQRLVAAIRMDDLERLLDPVRFLRIHRSHIVNLAEVTSMVPHVSGRLLVTLKDGTPLFASRSRSREVRRRTF
jgi:two-component system LytT family response regulator